MSSINDQVTSAETAEILRLAAEALSAPGDFVELGCYRGETSILLGKLLVENHVGNSRKTCGKPVGNLRKTMWKNLWIYDSFAGLPEKSSEDSSGAGANFQKGELFVSKREVIEKLRRHGLKTASRPNPAAENSAKSAENPATNRPAEPVVIVKKAWFDDLGPADLPPEIAFAFLDGDLYASIKTSLKLVFPRLTKQGIIIVHDYNNPELPGSARAVDEFLRAHPDFRLIQKHTLAILTRVC